MARYSKRGEIADAVAVPKRRRSVFEMDVRRPEALVRLFQVCHKCAVRFGPTCARVRLFNTWTKRFRAGLVVGKSLIFWWARQDLNLGPMDYE